MPYVLCCPQAKYPFKGHHTLGNHDHLVVDGMDKDTFQEITLLVQGKNSCTPHIKNYVIALAAKKTFLV
jgi:hypothetical protein